MEPTLSSPPPVSAPEAAKNSKPSTAESVPTFLSPPPPPAEKAQLTSPLAVVDNKKEAPAGATAPSSTEVVVNAEVNGVESLVEEESSDEGSSSKGSDSSKEEPEQDGKEEHSESDPNDGSDDDDDDDYKPDDIQGYC